MPTRSLSQQRPNQYFAHPVHNFYTGDTAYICLNYLLHKYRLSCSLGKDEQQPVTHTKVLFSKSNLSLNFIHL